MMQEQEKGVTPWHSEEQNSSSPCQLFLGWLRYHPQKGHGPKIQQLIGKSGTFRLNFLVEILKPGEYYLNPV